MEGYVFNLGIGSACWLSKKQREISHSSTKVENKETSKRACEVVWLRRMFVELQVENFG
jgi:hypothetical protein